MKVYYSHSWNDKEGISCLDGNAIPSNHAKYIKYASIFIFKLSESGEITKGILNEIQAAQKAEIPIYLWDGRKLIPSSSLTPQTAPLKKWKRNFSAIENPFRSGNEQRRD